RDRDRPHHAQCRPVDPQRLPALDRRRDRRRHRRARHAPRWTGRADRTPSGLGPRLGRLTMNRRTVLRLLSVSLLPGGLARPALTFPPAPPPSRPAARPAP